MVLTTSSYDKYMNYVLTRHQNKEKGSKEVQRFVCECGKPVYEKQRERHLQTKTHAELLRRKNFVPLDPKSKPIHPAYLVSTS